MKFTRLAFVALTAGAMLISASLPAAAADSGKFLADRHMARGVQCVSCHGTASPQPGAAVKTESCNACHQSLDAVAKRTQKVDPNPHYNHLVGLIRVTASRSTCARAATTFTTTCLNPKARCVN